MIATERIALAPGPVDAAFWPAAAAQISRWLDARRLSPRDAVVLLPHAALLPAVRAAFARRGGWQPRIETVRTLADSLGPPCAAEPGAPTGERALDRLTADALLRRAGFGAAWAQRDPRAFDDAVARLVDTASALQRRAHALPPAQRAAWWQALRDALPPLAGPGALERALVQTALAWAAADAAAPHTDALWALRPAAWVGVETVDEDPAIGALLAHAGAQGVATLALDGVPARAAPFDAVAALPPPRCAHAPHLEDEAAAATLALLDALDRGLAPVALIAQDRLVVRRIRALLERAGVGVVDETGWTLSTTRAGARVMALATAAEAPASRDALIEALKSEAPGPAAALEDAWRRDRPPPAWAQSHGTALAQRLAAWRDAGAQALAGHLAHLQRCAPRTLDALAADPAGRAVLTALHLDPALEPPAAWQQAAAQGALELPAFTAWLDAALEAATWRPHDRGTGPHVVVTPLAQAALRPFAAAVMPACDERRLGAARGAASGLPDAVARAFGLPHVAHRLHDETIAFAQLLRVPELTLLRRTHEADEPLAPSPLLERARLARVRLQQPLAEDRAVALPREPVVREPVRRPAPALAGRLPARLSASAVEALRACPYQFFARVALGLRAGDELDAGLAKRDHGRWLHAVLHRFHSERAAAPAPRSDADDRAGLLACADALQGELELDAAELLPFRAGFEPVADHYLAWLREHEAQGWRFDAGEVERRLEPAGYDGLALDGRLDRIDRGPGGAAMLIDYKSGNADALRARVKEPLEDTQLAFYAALLDTRDGEPAPRAIYLALDERKAPVPIEHADVAASAATLVEGLRDDLAALRAGAGAPALGEGDACRFCDARGLCRKDHWSPPEADSPRPLGSGG